MKIGVYCFVVGIIIVIITAAYLAYLHLQNGFTGPIYCIMITGKDAKRISFAKKSVQNFLDQTYSEKVLVIINHHDQLNVLPDNQYSNLFEFKIRKQGLSLGQLRNIALQMVAINACWTTWDDDDYRHPTYLTYLASFKTDGNTVAISNRFEYNKNNGVSWVSKKTDGFVLFLASFDNRIKYTDKDTMEDMDILNDFREFRYVVKVMNNNPKLYVRLVHTNNTSLYVKPSRNYLVNGPTYSERFTTNSEKTFISSILPKLLPHIKT